MAQPDCTCNLSMPITSLCHLEQNEQAKAYRTAHVPLHRQIAIFSSERRQWKDPQKGAD
jgi:hypothetical protein